MSKQQFVLCFAAMMPLKLSSQFVFVERTKDDWQKGRLNFPGGRRKPGESAEDAACRELVEETTLQARRLDAYVLGAIEGVSWRADVVFCPVMGDQKPEMGELPEGPVHSLFLRDALADPRVLSELKIVLPLCLAGHTGWIVRPMDRDPDKFLVIP